MPEHLHYYATLVAVAAFFIVPFHVDGGTWTTFAAVFWEFLGEIGASPPTGPGDFAMAIVMLAGPLAPLAPAAVAWEWHLLDASSSSGAVSALLVLQALVFLAAIASQALVVFLQGHGIGFGGSFEVGTLLWPVLILVLLSELGAVGASVWLAFSF
jgi:hypothetical protein